MPWPEEDASNNEARIISSTGDRQSTTMMLINVPEFLTQGSLISLLEDLSPSMRESFDFFYLPWDDQQESKIWDMRSSTFSRGRAPNISRRSGPNNHSRGASDSGCALYQLLCRDARPMCSTFRDSALRKRQIIAFDLLTLRCNWTWLSVGPFVGPKRCA
eukprot:g12354.t1